MNQPNRYKDEKAASLLSQFAAAYFESESNKDTLITVTKAEVLERGKKAIIFFTALPAEKEPEAMEFARRRRNDFRRFVMAKKSFGYTPQINFQIDEGEHNRQRIDELINKELPH